MHDDTLMDLTVEGIHTYHVGASRLLVHNTEICDPSNYRGRFNISLARQGKPRLPKNWDAHHRIPQKYRDTRSSRTSTSMHLRTFVAFPGVALGRGRPSPA